MDSYHHGGLAVPLAGGLLPSVMAIPSLATIPGSAAPTPSPHSSGEVPTLSKLKSLPSEAPNPDTRQEEMVERLKNLDPYGDEEERNIAGPSRPATQLQPLSPPLPIPGSYFPKTSTEADSETPTLATNPSENTAFDDRPRLDPIQIPPSTPDKPRFASYPDQAEPPPPDIRGNLTAFINRNPSQAYQDEGESTTSGSVAGVSSSPSGARTPVTAVPDSTSRRRAMTVTEGRSPKSPRDPDTLPRILSSLYSVSPAKSLSSKFRRRRASIGSPPQSPDRADTASSEWQAGESLIRSTSHEALDAPFKPFATAHPGSSNGTLPSESTGPTIRAAASPSPTSINSPTSPDISPRRSSLLASNRTDESTIAILGLSNVPVSPFNPNIDLVLENDAPSPPPRRSSLSIDVKSIKRLSQETTNSTQDSEVVVVPPNDVRSLVSSSHTGTDTTSASASADFYSPSGSSKEHPLSSATTSLSRSAKSGKEGSEEKPTFSAIRLQRSLEWEEKQSRHRRRLEKRRMVILELVETEVAYAQDLKTLVHVYLPQLFAMPALSESTTGMVARNASALLEFHQEFVAKMVTVLKDEGMGYDAEEDTKKTGNLEKVARRLASLFVDEISEFGAYKEYCAGSIAAAALVRQISRRPDFDAYERRCQIISSTLPHQSLRDLMEDQPSEAPLPKAFPGSAPTSPIRTSASLNRNRLRFRDFLITPIQRVCRYPLLLNQLLNAAASPSPTVEKEEPDMQQPQDIDEMYDVGVDVERALGAMRGVAEEADEARRVKEAEIKTATIIERIEAHPAITAPFLRSLGKCRLIGSLDVLHHHPTVAPLVPPVKVKYLAAFLYRGYLILAKVKKGKTYEVKHYLPLEVFEMIDISEGFLPHSIRLTLREHNFDLAASCEAEKEVWSAALNDARDESNMPPLELPASVSPFAARRRRMSSALPLLAETSQLAPTSPEVERKRHTVVGTLESFDPTEVPDDEDRVEMTFVTPPQSPKRPSYGFTPDRPRRPGQSSVILLRRASAPQRLMVDRGLSDLISEICATARSKAQLHQALFLPDVPQTELKDRMSIRDSTMLRRRRSFLDSSHSTFDIAFSGDVKGSLIPVRHHRSSFDAARSRHSRKGSGYMSYASMGEISANETDARTFGESADEAGGDTSDLGTLTQGGNTAMISRASSVASLFTSVPTSPVRGQHQHHNSLSNLRQAAFDFSDNPPAGNITGKWSLNRRKAASTYNLKRSTTTPHRARSTPVSPRLPPVLSKDLPPLPSLKDLPKTPGTAMPPPPFPMRNNKSDPATPRSKMSSLESSSSHQSHQDSNETHSSDPRTSTDAITFTARKKGAAGQDKPRQNSTNEANGGQPSLLRRSMSFIRDRADSLDMIRPTFSRESSKDDTGPSKFATLSSMSIINPRPVLSRNTTTSGETGTEEASDDEDSTRVSRDDDGKPGGRSRGSSSAGRGGESGNSADEMERRGDMGPRRKKSVRILQQLTRFTPI